MNSMQVWWRCRFGGYIFLKKADHKAILCNVKIMSILVNMIRGDLKTGALKNLQTHFQNLPILGFKAKII